VIFDSIFNTAGYVHVGTCRVSPDHNYLAYTVDTSGGERFVLQVKDLRSGLNDPKVEVDGVVSLAWSRDASSLFYTQSDENQRPYRQNIVTGFPVLWIFLGLEKGRE
jgi:protease II